MAIKLPNKLIPLPNADKQWHEKWTKNRNMLNLPHPWRAIFAGPPNSGKSTAIKNILLRANPPFTKIVVCHCDAGGTNEYDDVDAEMLSEIPPPEEWDGEEKTLCIIDDLEVKNLGKDQKKALSRLFGYVSTHKNVSVALCSQDPYQIPPIARRCANLFVLWQLVDLDSLVMTARKTGYSKADFHHWFKHLTKERHDSIWMDLTSKSPYPLRLNGFQLIKKSAIE